jgi:hypothetical protein
MELNFHLDDFLKYVGDNSSKAALSALQGALTGAAMSESPFLLSQAELVTKYMNMRKDGKLSGPELQSLLDDINTAMQAELLKMNMTTRVAAQALCNSLLDILKGALTILVTLA